ncbi:SET domain protein [Kalmanozyma brasiliensis GHG001]|uniref:Histone-lysine N-methyltransferase SET5 n=1 Tax=Kalmanozyma brasiliensis (strain GHG001) TaxID=1365824 RepID=V5GJ17_KALBG|nr:SET domain protein [Kalmanozyma brasiliensis GHG001]EST05977.1 SET domain protein [Kalmanozyma brasiliensis GHG001]
MVVPSETQIVESTRSHQPIDPSDLPRLLSTLELENDWSELSLKRFTSILSKHALIPAPSASTPSASDATPSGSTPKKGGKKKKPTPGIPKSYIDPRISFPAGVNGVYFDNVKGKGLVSTRSFSPDTLVFDEAAYIATPPPEALGQVESGELCGECFLPISSAPVALAIKSCTRCKYRFCGTKCWRGAMKHHALLCVGSSEGAKELMALVREAEWQSLHCVARSLARLISTLNPRTALKQDEEEEESFEEVYSRLSSFATVSELERRTRNPGWATERTSFEPLLTRAHTALRAALDPFHPSPSSSLPKADIISSAQKGLLKDLFDYPSVLKQIGRANINMEKFGGLYSVHSFLNHSCSPNVAIKHVPQRGISASMHIAAVALRPIPAGEELLISYVDPSTTLGRRQLLLYRDYCFGPCTCDRCTTELGQLGLTYDPAKMGVKAFLDAVAKKTGETDGKEVKKADASLEEELRASLGF